MGEQGTIIKVHVVFYLVISGVKRPNAFEQPYLGNIPFFPKQVDGILGRYYVPSDGQVGIDDFLHALA